MPLPRKPANAIFPLVGRQGGRTTKLYGTGFFIASDGTFMTARHVLDVTLEPGEEIVILRQGPVLPTDPLGIEYETREVKILDARFSLQFDIAVAQAVEPGEVEVLSIAADDPPINLDVLTMEFGGSAPEERGDPPRRHWNLNPYHRKGHILRTFRSEYPEREHPVLCLELSFPALFGASGAPILVEKTGDVVGMIVANVELHLLPAHVEKIESAGGTKEERRYYLPSGKAIHWSHLSNFLRPDTSPKGEPLRF